ncbi:uncharacterized protein LOC122247006 isoform X1 [Penaeus japonicus]|uniref:uncharacterized protein LOC122247006 isoform X1 n=1 Tax=Penaeus japonicus TaxID=27405 RepID=UPI001C71716B|nr:uncharacterized protein LOC122247006 isoform X1 [Penaeus japonicus]
MSRRTSWACVWAAVVAWAFASLASGVAAGDVLFKSPMPKDEIPVRLRMEDPKGGPTKTLLLHVKRAMLERYNVTKEEIENGAVVPDSEGVARTLIVKGIKFEIPDSEEKENAVVFHARPEEEPFLLDLDLVGHLTLASFQDDPTLVPEPPEALDWSMPDQRTLTSLSLNVSARSVVVEANRAMQISNRTAENGKPQQVWRAGAGLHLLVVNPCTTEVTLDKIFPTSEYGAHRDLTWTLDNIQDNRIVILASVHDGSLQLSSARGRLQALGSQWTKYYSFRDSWAWIFFIGGRTLGSGLAPNVGTFDKPGTPLLLEVDIPWGPSSERSKEKNMMGRKDGEEESKIGNESQMGNEADRDHSADDHRDGSVNSGVPVTVTEYLIQQQARSNKEREEEEAGNDSRRKATTSEAATEASCADLCPSWPSSEEWEQRRAFCATHDGFGALCNCESPFAVNEEGALPKPATWREDIPILIITGGRIHYLFRLLYSMGKQPGVRRDLILLVTDGYNTDVAKMADILRITLLVHRPEGVNPARISRNLRFGLFNAIKKFPEADKFIVLEDDLILSPDFYSYMQQTSWILENDPTVYCVSAFNHLSYAHTAYDVKQLYRAHSYPAYGWMMDKKGLEFILPKWLPSNVTHDWDHFMDTDILRRGRECVIPDINRSYHGGAVGVHLSASWATEKDFLNRTYNLDPDVVVIDPSRLLRDEYEREMRSLLEKAEIVDTDQLDDFNWTFSPKEGRVYVIYALKETPEDDLAFRVLGDALGVWNRDARDSHHHTWRLHYMGATLLVVGVPISPYSSYRRRDTSVFGVVEESRTDLEYEDHRARTGVLLSTHANMTNLPFHDGPAQPIPVANALFQHEVNRLRESTSPSTSSPSPEAERGGPAVTPKATEGEVTPMGAIETDKKESNYPETFTKVQTGIAQSTKPDVGSLPPVEESGTTTEKSTEVVRKTIKTINTPDNNPSICTSTTKQSDPCGRTNE